MQVFLYKTRAANSGKTQNTQFQPEVTPAPNSHFIGTAQQNQCSRCYKKGLPTKMRSTALSGDCGRSDEYGFGEEQCSAVNEK